jgi:hypothetical protein
MTELKGSRSDWLSALTAELYGPIPPAPAKLSFAREQLPDRHAERLLLDIDGFKVDAALWLPPEPKGIVIGLDFIGPIGTLASDAFPLDPNAIIALPGWHGGEHGPLDDSLRGASMHRVPVDLLLASGWGVLTSCYGSWVPDHPAHWQDHGLVPLLGDGYRAISLWAWALMRLVDVAQEIGVSKVALAGHSRLGKAALWAAANDERVAAVLSNDSGCGGASLESHKAGETLTDLRTRFPHWVLPAQELSVDQHLLLASVAPRGLYVASAIEDHWADPVGEYLSLQAAAPAWNETLPELDHRAGAALSRPKLGWHLRPGGHEILPDDWRRYIGFLEQLDA